MDFGDALNALKLGKAVARAGWNGRGMWLALQVPDAHSKMSLPYIYMRTAQGNFVPWLVWQTDVLAEDWFVASVVKEAIQWTGENLAEVLTFTGKHPKWDEWFSSFEHYEAHVRNDRQVFKIKTLEGTMEASPGDWIIRGLRGECYPCKPDIFAATYEPAEGC
jgi:hypothetical protein